MKLLLDEMISPQIARDLRSREYDVQAIKNDRPDLESTPDREIVERLAAERRGIVTNNVKDFRPIHDSLLAVGVEHYGMVFTVDATMPRDRASTSLWVSTLGSFVAGHTDEEALLNRIHFLS